MTNAPSVHDQANEVELHYLGLRDLVERAASGKIKRPAVWVDQNRARLVVAEHAVATLRRVAKNGVAP